MNYDMIYDLQDLLLSAGCFLFLTSITYAFRHPANNGFTSIAYTFRHLAGKGFFTFAGTCGTKNDNSLPVIPDAPVTAFRDDKTPDLRQFNRVNYLEMGPLMKKLLSRSHKNLENWTQTQRLEISPTRSV